MAHHGRSVSGLVNGIRDKVLGTKRHQLPVKEGSRESPRGPFLPISSGRWAWLRRGAGRGARRGRGRACAGRLSWRPPEPGDERTRPASALVPEAGKFLGEAAGGVKCREPPGREPGLEIGLPWTQSPSPRSASVFPSEQGCWVKGSCCPVGFCPGSKQPPRLRFKKGARGRTDRLQRGVQGGGRREGAPGEEEGPGALDSQLCAPSPHSWAVVPPASPPSPPAPPCPAPGHQPSEKADCWGWGAALTGAPP